MTDNIFQFLGLPADHRSKDRVTQKVKHIDEVPDSKKQWPMYGQVKKDGVYALVVKAYSQVGIFSRTGKRFTNVSHLEKDVIAYPHSVIPVAVYVTELCNDQCSLEALSGIVNPNRVKDLSEDQGLLLPSTYLSFHDALPMTAFISGVCRLTYEERYAWLQQHLPHIFDLLPTVLLADEEDMSVFFDQAVLDGEEGIVIKPCKPAFSTWIAGHKGFRMMKKVRGVDYDLKCIGAEEGKGKYKGLVANLIFEWKGGKQIKCMLGKGWTHEAARQMWVWYSHSINYSNAHLLKGLSPIGEIFQVYALQESSKGKLRLPKVGELRHDKTQPDVQEG